MAALLPHQDITISNNYEVLVDGLLCGSVKQRESILQSVKPNSRCIQFDEIKSAPQAEMRAILTGQDVIYVYHNQIDSRGDKASSENEVFTACEEAVNEIIKLIRDINARGNTYHFNPFSLDPMTPSDVAIRYRKSHLEAMKRAKQVIKDVDKNFGDRFGRYYGGLISSYRMEDAEIAIITIAGMTGTGMDAVDIAREKNIKVGLIKLRFTRPFPNEDIAEALSNVKAFSVIDRSVCFGWNMGPMHMETMASLADVEKNYAHFSSIGGLSGADISVDMILETIEKLEEEKTDPGKKDTMWYLDD